MAGLVVFIVVCTVAVGQVFRTYVFWDNGFRMRNPVVSVSQSPSCATGGVTLSLLEVKASRFRDLIRGKRTRMVLFEDEGCMRVGERIPVALIIRALPETTVVYRLVGPKVTILELEKTPYSELDKENKKLCKKKYGHRCKTFDHILILTAQLSKPGQWRNFDPGVPFEHPLAKIWNPQHGTTGLAVLDVRDQREFNKAHLPGSRHVPLEPDIARLGPLRPKDLRFEEELIDWIRGRPTLVISQNSRDFRGYNLISALALRNTQPMLHFRDGWEGVHSIPQETPETLSAIPTFTRTKEIQDWTKDNPAWVATGTVAEYNDWILKRGSAMIQVEEGFNSRGLPYRDLNLDLKKVLQTDKFTLSKSQPPKDRPVVVVGRNSLDWRAPKAALWLKSMGYKQVAWFRSGADAIESLPFVHRSD